MRVKLFSDADRHYFLPLRWREIEHTAQLPISFIPEELFVFITFISPSTDSLFVLLPINPWFPSMRRPLSHIVAYTFTCAVDATRTERETGRERGYIDDKDESGGLVWGYLYCQLRRKRRSSVHSAFIYNALWHMDDPNNTHWVIRINPYGNQWFSSCIAVMQASNKHIPGIIKSRSSS